MSVLFQVAVKGGDASTYTEFTYGDWVKADEWLLLPRE